ncbi:MAG: hypothetical protein U0792_07975 [Gemmataceae bacterium]
MDDLREPDHVNVFSGMLTDARTGKAVQIGGRLDRGKYYRVLLQTGYKRHGDPAVRSRGLRLKRRCCRGSASGPVRFCPTTQRR